MSWTVFESLGKFSSDLLNMGNVFRMRKGLYRCSYRNFPQHIYDMNAYEIWKYGWSGSDGRIAEQSDKRTLQCEKLYRDKDRERDVQVVRTCVRTEWIEKED